MDLPINTEEFDVIIKAIDNTTELYKKLKLTQDLMEDGQPYKKILRERYGYVA
tara:strand:+ start:476 stop:634 length:159 start_codon:yes stop_codon:yes gene_type:complete